MTVLENVKVVVSAEDNFTPTMHKLKNEITMTDMAIFALKGAMMSFASSFAHDILEVSKSFDHSLRRVEALTMDTIDQLGGGMEHMESVILELGATTMYTSQQVADAFSIMAQSGMTASEIVEAGSAMIHLAMAGVTDLPTASDIAVSTMRSFGVEAENLEYITDALTATFVSSNTTIQDLGESLKYIGPIAHMVGWSIEEVSGALGIMGNQGIKGSMAGMSLRMMIVRLLTPSREAAEIMKRLGLEIFDSNGQLKGLVDIIGELEKKGASVADILELFGTRAGSGVAALVNKGSEALEGYIEEIKESDGITKEVSEKMQSSFEGMWMKFISASERMKIELGEELMPTVLDLTEEFRTSLFPAIVENVKLFKQLLDPTTDLIRAFGKMLIPIMQVLSPIFSVFLTIIAKVATVLADHPALIKALVAMLITWKIANYALTVSQWALNLAMSANPIGAAIAAITLLVGFLVAAYATNEDFKESVDELGESLNGVKEAFGEFFALLKEIYNTIDSVIDVQAYLAWGIKMTLYPLEALIRGITLYIKFLLKLRELIKTRDWSVFNGELLKEAKELQETPYKNYYEGITKTFRLGGEEEEPVSGVSTNEGGELKVSHEVPTIYNTETTETKNNVTVENINIYTQNGDPNSIKDAVKDALNEIMMEQEGGALHG